MNVNLLKFFLFLAIFLLSACNNVERIEHIEVYAIEAWHYEVYDLEKPEPGDASIVESIGHKKVNAITTIEAGKSFIATDMKAIEDFFDVDGNYIRTEVIHDHYTKSYITEKESGEKLKTELKEPSTILIPNNIEDFTISFTLDNMTEEMKEAVKEHVLSFMDLLEK